MVSYNIDFNNNFLNQIIYHGIQNDVFLKKIRHIVPVNIFRTKEKEYLIKLIYSYYDEYKSSPKDNFYDIFKEHEKSMGEDLYQRCIKLIGLLKDITGSNPEYILNTIDRAIRHFKLEEASIEFAIMIKNKKYDEAKSIILKAIKEPIIDEPYYDFFKDKTFIEKRAGNNNYKMLTKIDRLDKIIGGLQPSWLINILGATAGGKSFLMIELAVSAILQGLNVLFISLEMGKEQIDERIDMTMGFMCSSKNKNSSTEILEKTGKDWIKLKKKVDSIYDVNKVLKNRQKFKKIGNGNLKVIAFNRGRYNYLDVERLIDELEETQGFFADVLIVDYLGIMKEIHSKQTKKERIGENCLGLKELAGKKNLIVISAMQGNRAAMKAKVFHSHLVADDIDTIFNSDLVLALCQTETEEKQNKYRIYIAKYRHGNQHSSIGIIRDLAIGQMALDTFEVKEIKQEINKETGVDF